VNVAVRTATTKDIEQLFGGRKDVIAGPSRKGQLTELLASSRSDYQEFSNVAVTQNLGRALPYLRLQDQPRVFWIDAICVNQSNLEERAQQVQRMAVLFKSATRVIFWIGEASDDSELVLDLLMKIAYNADVNYSTGAYTSKYSGTSDAHVSHNPTRISSKTLYTTRIIR